MPWANAGERAISKGERQRDTCLFWNDAAHFEEQTVLQPAKVLQVLVLPERVVKMAHARGEVSFGQLVDHVRRDELCGLFGPGRVLTGDAAQEGHAEVLQDRDEAIVFIETRQCARGGFERSVEPRGKFGEHQGKLFFHRHVGLTACEEHPALVDEVGHPGPMHLNERREDLIEPLFEAMRLVVTWIQPRRTLKKASSENSLARTAGVAAMSWSLKRAFSSADTWRIDQSESCACGVESEQRVPEDEPTDCQLRLRDLMKSCWPKRSSSSHLILNSVFSAATNFARSSSLWGEARGGKTSQPRDAPLGGRGESGVQRRLRATEGKPEDEVPNVVFPPLFVVVSVAGGVAGQGQVLLESLADELFGFFP